MLRPARVWLLLTLAGTGCARSPGAALKAPVVIISVDTLRADHLPVYGYRAVQTPAIDALAADSILFTNAYSNVPLTLPSHAALLTGLLPYENGVRDNIGFRLSPAHATLAGILRSNAYATGAAVSSFVLRKDRGLAAGFDSWDDSGEENPTRERAGVDSAAALVRWADGIKDKPLFLFLHIYEPHAPYTPPEPFRSRYAASPYDGEIAAADAAVGSFVAFLKRAGLYDRAVVILLSDHGEGLGDHGEQEHGVFLYREALHVPLLVKRPGAARKGRAVSAPVSLTDVVPTVLSLLAIPIPAGLHGLSLLSGQPRADRRIYAETFYPRLDLGWSDLACLVDVRYHYIHAPRPELYDLASDPAERRDLAPGLPAPFRSMRAALEATSRPFAMPEATSPEELKKLASLGYISVSPGAPAGGPLADPKDRVEELSELKQLFELYYAGRYREAIPPARALIAREPQILSAWSMLSDSLDHTGRLAEAIEALKSGLARVRPGTSSAEQLAQTYDSLSLLQERASNVAGRESTLREAVARGLASEPMKRDLARLYVASGRNGEAISLLTSTRVTEPESLDTLGVALAGTGRIEEAKQAFLDALTIEPGNARIALNLGTLLLDKGDPAGARDWLVKSVQSDPASAPAWSQLGLAQLRSGDSDGAARSWEKAVALDPKQYGSLYNLAIAELKAGRLEEARQNLVRFVAAAPRSQFAEQLGQARQLLAELKRRAGSAKQ